MINVFIVHSGADLERAQEISDYLEQKKTWEGEPLPPSEYQKRHANVLVLLNTNEQWKKEAKKLIKMADMMLFLQGENSAKSENIRWEVETALKMNKIVMVHALGDYPFPGWLIHKDHFTKLDTPMAYKYSMKEIKDRIDRFDRGEYDIFSESFGTKFEDDPERAKKELFDQYMMYQKTSEELVSRRQSVSSFYISVNAALMAFLGAVAGFLNGNEKFWVLIAISVAGIILDISWLRILDAYGTLNASKMKVINLIERQLPLKLYAVEWEVMSDKLNSKKYVSFTDSEKRIPKLFAVVYGLTVIASIILFFVL